MIKGLLIGIGMILPGVSGGVIAVILGIYDKIIYYLNNFRKDTKESIKFLFPLLLSVIVGAIISANLLSYIFDEYYVESCYLFIGLIIGSIPYLIKDCNTKDKKGINYSVLLITLFISAIFSVICKNNLNFNSDLDGGISSIIKLFLTGFLFVSGKIIPGISSSFMLMMIGMYSYFLEIMSNPIDVFINQFYNLIPILLGVIIGAIVLVKLMGVLLKKYYSVTYSTIIGFVLGSLIMIYPDKISLIGVLLLIVGGLISYYFSSKSKK